MTQRPTSLPADIGLGFKRRHFEAVRSAPQPVGFFEIHAENYMGAGGPPHAQLAWLRDRHALSIHGVAMSIGSAGPLDAAHLARLAALCERWEPEAVSEHLAWSSHDGVYYDELLPLPLTDETLARVAEHVDQVQCALGRTLLLENPAACLRFEHSPWPETEFLREVARRTGCGLLLDLNNVFVSAANLGFCARAYLADFPLDRVGQIHLAGHEAVEDGAGGRLLIDAHGSAIADPVRALYAEVVAAIGPVPTLVEWDNAVPDWSVLLAEAASLRGVLADAGARRAA